MFKKLLAAALLVSGLCMGAFAAQDIKEDETNNFKRHLLPLPHEIVLEKKVDVAPEKIGITLTEDAGQASRNAADLLAQSIKDKTGETPSGGGFEIVAGILDDDGKVAGIEVRDYERLKDLPNNEQAYVIQPAGENRLVVAALNDKGLFYGLTTLRQLLETHATRDSVTVPLATIVDWPDLKERGLWNGSSGEIIPFLSSIKVNFDTAGVSLGRIVRNKPLKLTINNAHRELAAKHAFNLCPKITHLNMFHTVGLYDAYPELAGKGKQAVQRGGVHRAPCASNPLLKQILVEAMEGLAQQGVKDSTVWTSEWLCNCQCPQCSRLGYRLGQFQLEAAAIYGAWKIVQEKYPDFNIRIFFSASDNIPDMRRVLKSIPNDVRLERCCGAKRVKHTPRDTFDAPPFDEKRKEGARLISYNLPYDTSMPRCKVLAYKDYIENLLRRDYEGGYALCHYPDKMNLDMNAIMMYAIGEWGWNNKGRNAREFGEAWAVREGYEEPEGVGEWLDIVAPVAFDIYGSSIPRFLEQGGAVDMVASRGKRELGKGVFRYLPALEDIDRALAACDKAMALAKRLANPSIIQESRAIQGYLRMVREVLNIVTWVADASNPTYEERVELQEAVNRLALACYRTNDGLEQWERVTGLVLCQE